MKTWKYALGALGAALLVVGCGGGGGTATSSTSVTSVKVFGDSLMDSGVFSKKFTIQSDAGASPFMVFPERIAAAFGVTNLCPFFKFTGAAFVPTTGCTNFSVAGGRINNLTNSTAAFRSSAIPFSITYQLAAGATSLAATDAVIVDGGSNDLADIAGAFGGATTAAGVGAYIGVLSTLLPTTTVGTIVGAAPTEITLANAGGAYAQALAKSLADSVKANVLAKGVSKALVVNSSDITLTPRFQAILGGITAGPGGAVQAAKFQAVVQGWTKAYNAALTQEFAGTSAQIFDFYTEGGKVFANPAQFGLTNVKTPACPVVAGGVDITTGQASLNEAPTVAVCRPSYMSANIPTGETSPDWWKTYAFSDNFHPAPALHQLIAQAISVQLARAGWL